MGILDAPPQVTRTDRDLLLSLDADRHDLFNRPDGPFTNGLVLPSGQTWVVTGDVSGSVMGPELKTLRRALTYDNRNGAREKAYMWTTATPFTRFSAVFSFGPGSTTNATVGFIISPKSTADTSGIPTSNGVPGVATNSIHGSFGPNSWSFLFFKEGVQSPVFANAGVDGTWATPLEVDKRYAVAIERLAVDAMRIWLPAARVGNLPRYLDVTDASILARTGVADKIGDLWPETGVQTACIEFFNPLTPSLATDRQGSFHGYACYGGGRAGGSDDPTFTAGLTVSGHRAVVTSGDTVIYADRTIPGHARAAVGLTTGAANVGTPVTVRFGGLMDEPGWTWTPDAAVYLDTTGLLIQTVPTSGFVRQLGWAVTATRIVIDPREPIALAS